MEDFLLEVSQEFTELNIYTTIFKFTLASIMGFLTAFNIFIIKDIFKSKSKLRVAKSQILLCLAGAMVMTLIAGDTSRALGVFALGGFVRFRTSIKEPADTVTMLILLALGMTIGVGLYAQAIIVFIFLYFLTSILHNIKIKEPIKNKNEN